MENPKEKIYSILKAVALEMGVEDIEFKVERPKDEQHGDFSSNIALAIFSDIKNQKSKIKNPFELAEEIVKILNSKFLIHNSDFDKVEVAPPGFINFCLSKKHLQNQVQNIISQGSSYGSLALGKGKTASVEFVSANPTGPLHIGNARGGPLGDTIANVLEKVGFKVTREYLHNDVGGQVERLGEAIYFTIHPSQKPKDYEVQYQGDYIKELSQSVKESLGGEDLSQEEFIEKAGQVAVELMLTEILKDCQDMGIKYDNISKESDLRKEVPQVLEKIKKSLKEKDGAKWFAPQLRHPLRSSSEGQEGSAGQAPDEFLKDRETVVKKSNGEFTYFASDIAYHDEKLSKNDLVLDILGSNHSGHVPRILAAVKALGYKNENYRCILYQYVRLKRGGEVVKMSKRAGTFVTAREVLDEVGKDAFRFFLLTPRTQTHMDFDLELAKKKSAENPVFYVQYAYTRICSIFSKYEIRNTKYEIQERMDLSLLGTKEEINLIRLLITFPYLVEEISQNLEVNALTTYALELATCFHRFYETNQVISKDENLTKARLGLLKATQITLKNTLDLLGVSAPEHM